MAIRPIKSHKALLKQIDKMLKRLTKNTREVEEQIERRLQELIDKEDFDLEGKALKSTGTNLAAKNRIRQKLFKFLKQKSIRKLIEGSIEVFASGYDKIVNISNEYFEGNFEKFAPGPTQNELLRLAKAQTLESMTFGDYKKVLLRPVDRLLTDHITRGRDLTELKIQLKEDIAGTRVVKGKEKRLKEGYLMSHYRRQLVSREALHRFARNYEKIASDAISGGGVPKYFEYVGGLVKDSREECIRRVKKRYFSEKEIESLTKLTKKEWPEKIPDLTAFQQAGGWNCLHTWKRISIFAVPVRILRKDLEDGYITKEQFDKVMEIRQT